MSANTTKVPSVYTTANVSVSAIFPVLSLLALLVRYRARHKGRQRFEADDWWIAIAWLLTLSLSVIVWIFVGITGVDYLKGNPMVSLPKSTQGLFVQSLMLQLSLSAVKISILCFYKRIFSIPTFRRAANIGIAIISTWGITYFFLVMFQLDPVSAAWTGKGRSRINSTKLNISQASTSIILDILVLCFPIPVISRLHMHLRRKILVSFIFWLGGFCCIAAICRLVFLVQGQNAATQSKSNGGYTAISKEAKTAIFTTVEPNCSIIAACLPCYGPLLEGGRTAESIIRSVRSALSLGSRKSPPGSSARASPKGSKMSRTHVKLDHGSDVSGDAESQVELKKVSREWASSQTDGRSGACVKPSIGNEDGSKIAGDRIEVTRRFETSDMV